MLNVYCINWLISNWINLTEIEKEVINTAITALSFAGKDLDDTFAEVKMVVDNRLAQREGKSKCVK